MDDDTKRRYFLGFSGEEPVEDEAAPILEAELADIERRYQAGLLNGEHADLETRRAYEEASERASEREEEDERHGRSI